MAGESVVLMSGSWELITTLNGITTGQRLYWDAVAVPHATPTTLPALGDPWEVGSQVLVQTITKVPIGDDTSLGFAYLLSYSDAVVRNDILGQSSGDNIGIAVTSSAEYDSFTADPQAGDDLWAWDGTAFIRQEKAMTVGKMSPVQSLQVTKRYRSSLLTLLQSDAALTGKINDNTWNGFAKGTVLYLGMSAAPVKELDSLTKNTKIYWNVTYNYQIKLLAGISTDTWQYVFVGGSYVRLSEDGTAPGFARYDKYKYASLPQPL